MRVRKAISFIRLMGRLSLDTVRTPRCSRGVPVAVLLAMIAGCASEPPGDAAAPADSITQAPDVAPAAPDSEPVSQAIDGAEWTVGDLDVDRPITGAALLREVRTARHDGFDRIVLDFGTDDVPPYAISYIDRPVRQCGSGDTVPLAGDAWLSITMQATHAHTEAGEPTVRERERAPGLPVLLELKMVCDFEAVVEWVAGVRSPERYRAFVLGEPNRLVVDIRHPGV